MDATLRSWRRKLQAEQCLFLVRPPCAAKGCRFEVIVSPMYGCTGCGRTHYCESSVLADKLGGVLVPEQGAGDACEFYVNTEEENVCALSQVRANRGCPFALFCCPSLAGRVRRCAPCGTAVRQLQGV